MILYAIDLALVNFVGAWMFLYAARAELTLERFARYVQNPLRLRNVAGGIVFAASIPVALFSPTGATLMWVGLFFVRDSGD